MSEACGQLRLAVSCRAVVPTRSASLTPLERVRGSSNYLQEFRYANPTNNCYPPQACNDHCVFGNQTVTNDLFAAVEHDFAPLITNADVDQCENNFHLMGEYRRLCLILLSKSSADLIQGIQSEPEMALSMLDVFEAWEEGLKHQQEVLRSARARFLVAANQVAMEA